MEIKPSTEGSVTTLALEGWLDTTSATELADAIDNIDDTCTELILDFAALEYISSSGLRQVVSAWKKMGGNLRVINNSDFNNVVNLSRKPSQAVVLLPLEYSADLNRFDELFKPLFA